MGLQILIWACSAGGAVLSGLLYIPVKRGPGGSRGVRRVPSASAKTARRATGALVGDARVPHADRQRPPVPPCAWRCSSATPTRSRYRSRTPPPPPHKDLEPFREAERGFVLLISETYLHAIERSEATIRR
ncbi:hypothetical protein AAFF_G00049130 [Aldrovandia affinis]|uniref:Uncharacterized protein n=1 Tax=Aldrovandia affinis TaxID=143900 RepID=A0AAD7WER8_9TELE|nr:hypothetical protein AAFF_G00049130 [Aldrovandia affinis]